MTNKEFSEKDWFVKICTKVFGTKAGKDGSLVRAGQHSHLSLKRQASKYRRAMGVVWKEGHDVDLLSNFGSSSTAP